MFKISQNPTYTWPVSFELPTDGGRTEKFTFDAVFKRLKQSEIEDMRKQIETSEINDADMVRQVLVGWNGVHDDTGEIPFSEGALSTLLDVPTVSTAIILALLTSLSGAKRKN
jgi:hypothetical protein